MFTIVQAPDRAPHRCVSCLVGVEGSDREFWVDFGDAEAPPGDGPAMTTTYVCSACFGAAAKDAGFATPKDKAALEQRIADTSEQLFEARVKADGLEQGLEGLLRARFVDGTAAEFAVSGFPADPSGESSESAPGGLLGAGAGEAAEPHVERGLADLHAAPELDADIDWSGFGSV